MKPKELRTVAYVRMGEGLVCTDKLTAEQRRRLATWLKATYLGALFEGEAMWKEEE